MIFVDLKPIDVQKLLKDGPIGKLSKEETALKAWLDDLNKSAEISEDNTGNEVKTWTFRKLSKYLPISTPIKNSEENAYERGVTRGGNLRRSGTIRDENTGIKKTWTQSYIYRKNVEGTYFFSDPVIEFSINAYDYKTTDIEEAFVLYYLCPQCANGHLKNEYPKKHFYELYNRVESIKSKFESDKKLNEAINLIYTCSESDLLVFEGINGLNHIKGTPLEERKTIAKSLIEEKSKTDPSFTKRAIEILSKGVVDKDDEILVTINESKKNNILTYDSESNEWKVVLPNEEIKVLLKCDPSTKDSKIIEYLKSDNDAYMILVNRS